MKKKKNSFHKIKYKKKKKKKKIKGKNIYFLKKKNN